MTATMAIDQYKKDAVISAPPERIVLMLYDGAMRHMNLALKKLKSGDRSGYSQHLSKGQAIVAELVNSLDAKLGGEVGKNLERLYLYIIDRLIEANLNGQGQAISDCIRIMKTLKEGWEDAIRQTCGQPA